MSATLRTTQLRAYEAVIKEGQKKFIEVGQALAKIKEGKLYREAGFRTFEDYCQQRWEMGRNYANQLIRTADLGANAPIPPANAGQARVLASVPEDKRTEVMEAALESGERMSARLIEETWQDLQEPEPHPGVVDVTPVPKCKHCPIHCG